VSELLSGQEILQKDALVHLVIERNFVQCLLQFPSKKFIVNKCLLWQQVQVLLECLPDEMLLQVLEEGVLRGLAAQEGEHAPGDTNDWEVAIVLPVVLR